MRTDHIHVDIASRMYGITYVWHHGEARCGVARRGAARREGHRTLVKRSAPKTHQNNTKRRVPTSPWTPIKALIKCPQTTSTNTRSPRTPATGLPHRARRAHSGLERLTVLMRAAGGRRTLIPDAV
ncbi:hypothetical protein RR46_00980 [Papilio xuthus]|uniref:Uncharacterized protein n=1 Tax=Papilio xuthus TaxID=66420 RepID=A0A0N0PA79_PAPXU|nr:hypothetical protein RR46_00980 [Papilio xuthus]